MPLTNAQLNAKFKQQKAALTRAVNSKDPEKVKAACIKAVKEWNEDFPAWPDDWHTWNIAFQDAQPWGPGMMDLEDLNTEILLGRL